MSDIENNEEYRLFEFTDEIIDSFREKGEIPVHFYNKDGQILIYKKEDATEAEIDRLLRFVKQGVYYHLDDMDALGLNKKKGNSDQSEAGLADTKLLSKEHAEVLTESTSELFDEMKTSSVDALMLATSGKALQKIFTDFESQPDAMNGLVNIIELMTGKNAGYEVELAVKRTVTAMAIKTRGMNAASARDQSRMMDLVMVTMMSSLLCDIGYTRMQIPEKLGLNAKEYAYIQNHSLMSYLMLAHDASLDPRIKRNILVHHRPVKDHPHSNNFPTYKVLISKLRQLGEKYAQDPSRANIARDIQTQINLLEQDPPYDEDANILAIASEFASLTSKVPWREAFSAERAIRMIVNNSYFTYSDRILREFLDYVSMSLNNNQRILNEGDYIIVSARGTGKTYFEVCQITASSRYQSRPGIDRFATIYPDIGRAPRVLFTNFNLDKLKPDPRYAHYELSKDDTRHIVYAVDPAYDETLYDKLVELTLGRRKVVTPNLLTGR